MSDKKKNAAGTISIVMIITLIGKVLGLFRDRLLTINYGATTVTDAFLTASRIPRVFFDAVFASAITASFIPVFNELMAKEGKKKAFSFSSNFISVISLLTAVLSILGMGFAPFLVDKIFAPEYAAQTKELCSELTRILFPTMLFTGIAYSFIGILQSMGEFNLPAFISVVSNGIIIIYYYTLNDKFGIYGLAVAFLIGWLAQAVVQIPKLKKFGYSYRPNFSFTNPDMKKVFFLMLPVMVSTWVQPINLTINTAFASSLEEGSVSAIEYSNNLYMMIAGIFILSVMNVIFPKMAKQSAENDTESFKETIRSTMHSSIFFVMPMTAGLMALATPIISLIYGGGKFTEHEISLTSGALVFMAIGMIGYAMSQVLNRVYFARQNAKVPLISSVISIAVNVILCIALTKSFGIIGLAISTSVATIVNGIVLALPLKKMGITFIDRAFIFDFIKITVSSLIMGVAVYFGADFVLKFISGKAGDLVSCCVGGIIGVIIYFALTLIMKLDETKMAVSLVKRK